MNEVVDPVNENEDWCDAGPLLQLSVLSYMGRSQSPDENSKIRHRETFVRNAIEKIKNSFSEVEIVDEKDSIEDNIRLLCNGKTTYFKIRAYVDIGFKRQGYVFLEILPDSLLHTEIYFVDEDENEEEGKYREEANALLQQMIRKLNSFCGTLGLESNVRDIFKIDQLLDNIGDESMYGIENVIWRIK